MEKFFRFFRDFLNIRAGDSSITMTSVKLASTGVNPTFLPGRTPPGCAFILGNSLLIKAKKIDRPGISDTKLLAIYIIMA